MSPQSFKCLDNDDNDNDNAIIIIVNNNTNNNPFNWSELWIFNEC